MTAPLGHNMPPPFEAFSMALEDVRLEAGNWLDGSPIETQAQADEVGRIMSGAKKLAKDMDAARADEKKPHDEAGKAVQAKWKPLLEQAAAIVTAAQGPLSVFLNAVAAQQAQEAQAARQAALDAQQAAINAQRVALGNIEAMERAAELQREADKAASVAGRAEKARPLAAGEGRATGLRTSWTATVTDYPAMLTWLRKRDPEALRAFLSDYASKAVRGGARDIPGVSIVSERKVA